MQPTRAVVQRMLNGQAERYGKVVDALPEAALNWRPGDEQTNSVAQLIRHVTAVQETFFGRALGGDPPYDHRHALRNDPATKEELHGLIADANARKGDYLARLDGLDLGEMLAHPTRAPVQRAWLVIHTADHGQEHPGHAERTGQRGSSGAADRRVRVRSTPPRPLRRRLRCRRANRGPRTCLHRGRVFPSGSIFPFIILHFLYSVDFSVVVLV